MGFGELASAALELGVVPAVALFLLVSMHQQNKRLLADRRETELFLLKLLGDVAQDKRNNEKPDANGKG